MSAILDCRPAHRRCAGGLGGVAEPRQSEKKRSHRIADERIAPRPAIRGYCAGASRRTDYDARQHRHPTPGHGRQIADRRRRAIRRHFRQEPDRHARRIKKHARHDGAHLQATRRISGSQPRARAAPSNRSNPFSAVRKRAASSAKSLWNVCLKIPCLHRNTPRNTASPAAKPWTL